MAEQMQVNPGLMQDAEAQNWYGFASHPVDASGVRHFANPRGTRHRNFTVMSILVRVTAYQFDDDDEFDPELFREQWTTVLRSELRDPLSHIGITGPSMTPVRTLGRGDDQSLELPGHFVVVDSPTPIGETITYASFNYGDLAPPGTQDPKPKRPSEKSAWAQAIGPVFSKPGLADALSWTIDQVDQADALGSVLSITTREGERVYPASQIRPDATTVRGISWLLAQLDPVMDRYTLAAWLNKRRQVFDNESAWNRMRSSDEFPEDVRRLIEELRTAWAQ